MNTIQTSSFGWLVVIAVLSASLGAVRAERRPVNAPERDLRKQKKIEALDPDFFDESKKKVEPTYSESARTGKRRYRDSGFVPQWQQTCAPVKDKEGFAGYKDCVYKERNKTALELERKFQEVEDRQAQPLKNVDGSPEESKSPIDGLLRLPAQEQWKGE